MRYLIIHGHFYQPPRENPWTERIGREAGAHPFHNWNARIQRECYAPNRAARILDDQGRIAAIANNYRNLSFNVGPTLLDWMVRRDPETVAGLVAADQQSARDLGHGNAMAQAYSHPILPLLSRRDKTTQVRWGLAHFAHTYGRRAEGMWLSETAADLETLDVLAEEGIRFTVLAPGQLAEVQDAVGWRAPAGARDLGRWHRVQTSEDRDLAVFFYDGGIAQRVAFERLLDSGADFAAALRQGLEAQSEEAPLLSIATDGETYGHHHRFGEMALAFALRDVASDPGLTLTNYAAFLADGPPATEARIVPVGSWSCAHGVERWRSDCGCSTGGAPGTNQAWRAPLFEGMVHLREALTDVFEGQATDLLRDPWEARNDYIRVLLDPSSQVRREFLDTHARSSADPERVWRVLEMERHALLMFTSCGWFFHDLAGIETQQVLRYAGKAMELAGRDLPRAFQKRFLEILSAARTNTPPHRSGSELFLEVVGASRFDTARSAAEAVFSRRLGLGDEHPLPSPVFRTQVEFDPSDDESGSVAVSNLRTDERTAYQYELERDDRPELRVRLERVSPRPTWQTPLPGTPPEEPRDQILGVEDLDPEMGELIVDRFLLRVEDQTITRLREILADREPVIGFLERSGTRPPRSLGRILEVIWRHDLLEDLEQLLERPGAMNDWVRRLRRFSALGLDRDDEPLARGLEPLLVRAARRVVADADQPELFRSLADLLEAAERLDPGPDLWETQNVVYSILSDTGGTRSGESWNDLVHRLGFGAVQPEEPSR